MGLHVEWLNTGYMSTTTVPEGTEIGEDTVNPGNIGLILNYDEAVVIEGPKEQLLKVLVRAMWQVMHTDEKEEQA